MTLGKKRIVNGLLAMGLSVLLLFLTFRKVDLPATIDLLKQVRWTYVGLCIFLMILAQLVRTYRWNLLVRPFANLSTMTLFRVANLGSALILLLPFRLGDLARPCLMKNEANVPMSAGFGAVLVERTIDGLFIVFIYFLATFDLPQEYAISPYLKYSAFVAAAIFGTLLGLIAIALFSQTLVTRIIERIGTRISPRLTGLAIELVSKFVNGLRSLPNLKSLAGLFILTALYFCLNAMCFYAVMLAFGWSLPIICAFLLMCVITLGTMVPAGPGHLGTYQAAVVIGLSIFGVGSTEATAYGLVIYPLTVLVIVGCGLPFLFGAKRPSLAQLTSSRTD